MSNNTININDLFRKDDISTVLISAVSFSYIDNVISKISENIIKDKNVSITINNTMYDYVMIIYYKDNVNTSIVDLYQYNEPENKFTPTNLKSISGKKYDNSIKSKDILNIARNKINTDNTDEQIEKIEEYIKLIKNIKRGKLSGGNGVKNAKQTVDNTKQTVDNTNQTGDNTKQTGDTTDPTKKFEKLAVKFNELIRQIIQTPTMFKINSLNTVNFKIIYDKITIIIDVNKRESDEGKRKTFNELFDFLYYKPIDNENVSQTQFSVFDPYSEIKKTKNEQDTINASTILKIINNDVFKKVEGSDIYIHIMKMLDLIMYYVNNSNVTQEGSYTNTISILYSYMVDVCDKIPNIIQIIKIFEDKRNIKEFKNVIDENIKETSSTIINTLLKLNNIGAAKHEYNKRFDIMINDKKDALMVKYNDIDIPFYLNENTVSNDLKAKASNNYNIKGNVIEKVPYNKTYFFGKFTDIYLPNKNNAEIVSEESIKNLIKNAKDGKPIFILGYGASGSGKTSSLVYYSGGKDANEKNGIIIHICNKLGNQGYKKMKIETKEYFKTTYDIKTVEGTQICEKDNDNTICKSGTILYDYNDNGTDFYFSNYESNPGGYIQKHKYNSAFNTKNVPFSKDYTLGSGLSYILDTDRFVKATTNNPASSRSHVLIFITLENPDQKKINIILGDFGGVENKFLCEDVNVVSQLLNIERANTTKPFYSLPSPPINNDEKIEKMSIYDPVYEYEYNVKQQDPALMTQIKTVKIAEELTQTVKSALIKGLNQTGGYDGDGGGGTIAKKSNQVTTTKIANNIFKLERVITPSPTNVAIYKKYFKLETSDNKDVIKCIAKDLTTTEKMYDFVGIVNGKTEKNDSNNEKDNKLTGLVIRNLFCETNLFNPTTTTTTNNDIYKYIISKTDNTENSSKLKNIYDLNIKRLNFFLNKEEDELTKNAIQIILENQLYQGDETIYIEKMKTACLAYIKLLYEPTTPDKKSYNISLKFGKKYSNTQHDIDILKNIKNSSDNDDKLKQTLLDSSDLYGILNNFFEFLGYKTNFGKSNRQQDVFTTAKLLFKGKPTHLTDLGYHKNVISRISNQIENKKDYQKQNLFFSLYDMDIDQYNDKIELNTLEVPEFDNLPICINYNKYDIIKTQLNLNVEEDLNALFYEDTSKKKYSKEDIKDYIKEYENVYEKIKETKCRIDYGKMICTNRVVEGEFINETLLKVRDTIKEIIIQKQKDVIYNSPEFINECLDAYCPGLSKCFEIKNPDKKSYNKNIPSYFFKEIMDYLNEVGNKPPLYPTKESFYDDILIYVFCVFNISETANNPPPVPYLDINALKRIYYEYELYGGDLTDTFKIKFKKEYDNIIKKIKNEFKNKLGYMIDENNKINNDLNESVIKNISQKAQKVAFTEDQKNKIKAFIEMIDNSNAISAIGTLDYIDQISKFNTTNNICSADFFDEDDPNERDSITSNIIDNQQFKQLSDVVKTSIDKQNKKK